MMHWVPEKWLAFAVTGRFGQEIRDFMAACYHWAQKKRDVHQALLQARILEKAYEDEPEANLHSCITLLKEPLCFTWGLHQGWTIMEAPTRHDRSCIEKNILWKQRVGSCCCSPDEQEFKIKQSDIEIVAEVERS
jgi:hypothetical protein